jgi:hypothetical protein
MAMNVRRLVRRPVPALGGVVLLAAIALVVAGCGGGPSASSAPSADPATDKLAQILARGTLVSYGELDYPPQSIRVEGAPRATDTRCLPNQITAQEVTGFDIETTKLVAKELGVEACFIQLTWTEVRPATGTTVRPRLRLHAINRTRMSTCTDPALLLHPAAVPRPGRLAVPGSVRPRPQADRDV